MTQTARDFLTEWLRANLSAEVCASPADMTRAREMADQCGAEARAAGISDHDLNEAVGSLFGGDLTEMIADAMEAAGDAEDQRRSG